MIPTKINIDEYVKYLQAGQPNIAPRTSKAITWTSKTGIIPGTDIVETYELPTWRTPQLELVNDWQPFYADIDFPAFIYVYNYDPLRMSWV